MRLVFVGGGTGGHFYPLMAVAEAIRERDQNIELFYMGPDAYNQAALDALAIRLVRVPAGKKRNYFSILNYLDLFKTGFGVATAFFKLLRLYPDAVMSKGGYTSVPVVIAAYLLRIPIVVHESDAVPGRANKLAARFAKTIAIAHPEVAKLFPAGKVVEVGMPIRRAVTNPIPDPQSVIGVGKDRPVVLVTGGSTGAERLNNFVIAALPRLLQHYNVIHQVGEANMEKVSTTA